MTGALLALLLLAPAAAPPACVQTANEQFRVGDRTLAVRTAETCWNSTRNVGALLIGCQARVSLGHFAHAARILAVYDVHAASDPSLYTREGAAALRAEISGHTGTLHVVLTPPLAPGERLAFELARRDPAAPAPIVGDAPELARASATLDVGRWSLTLRREHHEPTRVDFTISLRSTRTVTAHMPALTTPPAVRLATRPTSLRLGPARALRRGVELRLRLLDTAAEIVRIHHADTLTLHLAPGRWHLVARARGHTPLHTTVESGVHTSLELRRESP